MATQTVQDMVKQVEKQNLDQTAARSVANPGVLTVGGQVGATAGGQGIASVPVVNQAITTTNPGYTAPATRYNADGSLNTGAPTPAVGTPGATSSTGIPGLDTKANLTQEQYQAQNDAKPVDENAIREQVRSENQARIDAINGAYDSMIRDQTKTNEANAGSVRSINARSGLIGSDFGATNDANQRASGDKALKQINLERDAQITSTLANINALADGKIKAQKEEALGNANAYKDYLVKAQATSKDAAINLGKSGVSFDQLKEKAPDQLKQILSNTGYDEFTLAAVMNGAQPAAQKINYQFKTVGNRVIGYGLNPATNQIETIEKDLPVEQGGNLQDYTPHVLPDGSLVMTPKQIDPSKPLKDQVLMYGAEGQYAKDAAPMTKVVNKTLYQSTDGGKTWTLPLKGVASAAPTGNMSRKIAVKPNVTNAVHAMTGELAKLKGEDGFVSPDTYTTARNKWIEAGYNPTDFDSKLKGFVNPNNPNYNIKKQ